MRGSCLVCLASLVWSGWSGLVWLYSCLGEELPPTTRSVLSVRSFVSYYIQYTVYSIQYSFCLVFALLILTRDRRY